MSDTPETSFAVAPGASVRVSTEVRSPEAPPGLDFNELEVRLYEYICAQLKDAGIQHMTAGMPIAVIVRTYRQWIEAMIRCETDGRTQKSEKNGWVSSTPWAEDEKRLKMELGQWLPKACLTIPSFTRVKKDAGASGVQDDLFDALVRHGQNSPAPTSQH